MSGAPPSGPPGAGGMPRAGGGGPPTPEQIAMFKEAGVRKLFASDIGAGFGPFVMGYVLLPLLRLLPGSFHFICCLARINGKRR